MSEPNEIRLGRGLVVLQAVLLGTLLVLPSGDAWPTPTWLDWLAGSIVAGGLIVAGLSALRLGPALTPTPLPKDGSILSTAGEYRYVRHPIYSGVLLVVLGVTVRSGNGVTAAVALATVAFFQLKARWEEQLLRRRFPDYEAYSRTTPRFVPRPRR